LQALKDKMGFRCFGKYLIRFLRWLTRRLGTAKRMLSSTISSSSSSRLAWGKPARANAGWWKEGNWKGLDTRSAERRERNMVWCAGERERCDPTLNVRERLQEHKVNLLSLQPPSPALAGFETGSISLIAR
jgi:hypothetical protein